MKILAIETSSQMLSLAISNGDDCCWQQDLHTQKHAKAILSEINNLLDQAQCAVADLDAITVSNGPGSFIGVRTGLTVAKTLAFAADLPIVAVSSLRAWAQTAYLQYGVESIAIAVDARLQSVYGAEYKLESGIMQYVQQDAMYSLDDIYSKLQANSLAIAGNATQVYDQLDTFADRVLDVPYPRAEALIKIAEFDIKQGLISSATSCSANYLRNKVAKTKQERQANG